MPGFTFSSVGGSSSNTPRMEEAASNSTDVTPLLSTVHIHSKDQNTPFEEMLTQSYPNTVVDEYAHDIRAFSVEVETSSTAHFTTGSVVRLFRILGYGSFLTPCQS